MPQLWHIVILAYFVILTCHFDKACNSDTREAVGGFSFYGMAAADDGGGRGGLPAITQIFQKCITRTLLLNWS